MSVADVNTSSSPASGEAQPYPENWIAAASALGAELSATATARDAQGVVPVDAVQELKRRGFVNIFLPRAHGGAGASLREAAWSVLELSSGDASVGALLAFHLYNSLVPQFLDFEDDNAEIVRLSARNRWYWGNVTQYVNKDFIAVPRPDGGFVVNGTKKWNTGAPVADVTTVLAVHDNREQFIYAYVPTSREGVTFHGDWNQIGLRGADSSSVTFDNVRIHPEEIIPWKHGGVQTGLIPFWTTFAAVYYSAVFLGTTRGALHAARAYAHEKTRQHLTPGVASIADDPFVQAEFGGLWTRLEAGFGYLDRVIAKVQDGWNRRRELGEDERSALSIEAVALRLFSTELALEITPRIFDFAGGSATASRYGFDRFWRDARTLSVHDARIYSQRLIGDFALNDRAPRYGSQFHAKAS